MSPELTTALERALDDSVVGNRPLSGGDINDAHEVRLASGTVCFVKSNRRAPQGMFTAEAQGLEWLRESGTLKIPEVIAFSEESPRFLVLEYLQPGVPGTDFDERLGRGLAQLHRFGSSGFGWPQDNFIGLLPQLNALDDSWAEFYGSRRLLPQVERAARAGSLDHSLQVRLEGLVRRLSELVGAPEAPSRVHGDLWGGNLHVGPHGEPCLIDPAVYGGHREVDLAMMKLFGGFSRRVFDAYHEEFPLTPGASERVSLYQLYPLLVHLNLFGGSYRSSVEQAAAKYA